MLTKMRSSQSPSVMAASSSSLLLVLLTLLLSLSLSWAATDDSLLLLSSTETRSADNGQVQAMFVFGDSVLDAGSNSLFPSLLQANFKPYGTVYFGKATGRFTNGRTYADFFANYIGLPLLEPYLARKDSIIKGVNYASAGSGLLRTSNEANHVIPFPDQISQFGQTKLAIEQTLKSSGAAKALFSKSLFLINIGANDLITYLFVPSGSIGNFIDGLLVIMDDSIKVLYEAGARKIMILGTGKVGCVPGVLAVLGITDGKCNELFNTAAEKFNMALEKYVLALPKTYPGMQAIIGKPYSKFAEFLTPGNRYGFTEGVTACCGSGPYNGVVQCGRPADLVTNPPTNLCDNVDKHLFWDYYHPTDKAYAIMAAEYWSGNTSYVAPVNLKTLVSMSL